MKTNSRFVRFLKKNAIISNLIDNYGVRTVTFAGISLWLNVIYAIFNGVYAIIYKSGWYTALCVYYFLLAFMRISVMFFQRKRHISLKNNNTQEEQNKWKITELKRYVYCGIGLTVMPLCLSLAITLIITNGRGYSYAGLTIYAVATYTFYKVISSIVNVVKAKKQDDYTIRALRNIGLADSAVSLLALQTAMFSAFGQGADTYLFNVITGAGVCALTVIIGASMIYKGKKEQKELKKGIKNDEN